MLIFGDNGSLSPGRSSCGQTSSGYRLTWRLAILHVSSALLLSCCSQQKQQPPIIVGRAQVLAVDNQAGTVTITLALYQKMLQRLKHCRQKLQR